jgi:hypothetical protein
MIERGRGPDQRVAIERGPGGVRADERTKPRRPTGVGLVGVVTERGHDRVAQRGDLVDGDRAAGEAHPLRISRSAAPIVASRTVELNPLEFDAFAIAARLAAALDGGGIPYAIGAIAYGLWGDPRGTQDAQRVCTCLWPPVAVRSKRSTANQPRPTSLGTSQASGTSSPAPRAS